MHHDHHQWTPEERRRREVKVWCTWGGIGLCVGLFFYLTHLAKRALARAQQAEEEGFEVDDI